MKILRYIILFAVVLTQVSCFESKDVISDDTRGEKYKLYDYYFDAYGNEGVIAYIQRQNGGEPLCIIALSIDEAYESWGPMGEIVYNDSILTIEDPNDGSTYMIGVMKNAYGVAMHQAMTSMGIERFPAQYWCNSKNKNEPFPRAGSWRLPTFYELRLIFGEKGEKVKYLNSALSKVGGTPIKDQVYWTCVEDMNGCITITGMESDYDPENRAVITTANNETFGNKDRWIKKNRYYVRAIKYVYYHK